MGLDAAVIHTRLAALEEYLQFLRGLAQLDQATFLGDPRNYRSGERFLHLAIESVFDIGSHCIAGLGLSRPNRYADILPTLTGVVFTSS